MVNNGCRGCGVEERRRGDHCQDQGNRTTPSYVAFTNTEPDQLAGRVTELHRRRQDGLRHSWLQVSSLRGVADKMVPANGNFTTALVKGNHKAAEIHSQTCQHLRSISLLGVKQI